MRGRSDAGSSDYRGHAVRLRWHHGVDRHHGAIEGLPEALRRAQAYHQVGADALFVEAPRTRDELAEIGRALPGIKIANIVEGGRTPIMPAATLTEMGFKIAIYANLILRSSVKAIQASLEHLHANGDSHAIVNRMITMEERARVTQKDFLDSLEKRFTQ